MHTIQRQIRQTGLRSPNLDVLAFAFIPLQRNAGQPPNRIGNVRIGQARDYFGWEHLDDIVGGHFAIQRLYFSAFAFSADDDLFIHRVDIEYFIGLCHLT